MNNKDTFDHKHYVPVLRWRPAEKEALLQLFGEDSSKLTPLIELHPLNFTEEELRKAGGLTPQLKRIATEIGKFWGKPTAFIDFLHLEGMINFEGKLNPLEILFNDAINQDLHLIPVTGLERNSAYQRAVSRVQKQQRSSVCLRVSSQQVESLTFKNDLDQLMNKLTLQPEHVHLLVDLKLIIPSVSDYNGFYPSIPFLKQWKTLTIVAGAFPKDLTQFTVGEHLLRRLDWLCWHSQTHNEAVTDRPPTYGDYTIQHPFIKTISGVPNPSASIRYTSSENWVIMRGEGLRNPDGPGHRQYPANALQLCGRPEYCGENYCEGDRYFTELSRATGSKGIPKTLLRAGINHHLTFVVRQISSQFSS